jgi:hypothetical protein
LKLEVWVTRTRKIWIWFLFSRARTLGQLGFFQEKNKKHGVCWNVLEVFLDSLDCGDG